MDFCFVSEVFPYMRDSKLVIPGGGEAHAFFLAKELIKRGHTVRMVCGRWPVSPKIEDIDGIHFIRYGVYSPWFSEPMVISLKNMLINNVQGLRLLNKEIKRKRPDFIVAPMSFALPRAFLLSKAYGIPLIAEVHDIYEIPLYLRHYKQDYGLLVYPGILYVWMYNNLPKYADLVETVSSQNVTPLVERYGVKRDKIFVTGNGIDFNKYIYSTEKKQLITILGRLVSYKRVDTAIEIFKKVQKKIDDVKLVIIGDGPDKEKIARLTKDDSNINMLGFVSEETKISLLQQSKIVVSCSEFEGFGIVPVEAFACGAFPVVSDIPAHNETIGGYGYIFTDVDDAVNKICHLLQNEDQRKVLAKRGRDFVEANYTWSKVCDRFLQKINSMGVK